MHFKENKKLPRQIHIVLHAKKSLKKIGDESTYLTFTKCVIIARKFILHFAHTHFRRRK